MAEIALIHVRDDNAKAEALSHALQRYGFSVCRSASVFQDFRSYCAVLVLLSPGAANSTLIMETAARAMDWGKLIPVFVSLCKLPEKLTMVKMHDLTTWEADPEDAVVQTIAYHAHRLAGLSGKPDYMVGAAPVDPATLPPLAVKPQHTAPIAIAQNPSPPVTPMPRAQPAWQPHASIQPQAARNDYGWQHQAAPQPQPIPQPAPQQAQRPTARPLAALDESALGARPPAAPQAVQPIDSESSYFLGASLEDGLAPIERRRRRRPLFNPVFAMALAGGLLGGMIFMEENSAARTFVTAQVEAGR
jgi:hypothetical protein